MFHMNFGRRLLAACRQFDRPDVKRGSALYVYSRCPNTQRRLARDGIRSWVAFVWIEGTTFAVMTVASRKEQIDPCKHPNRSIDLRRGTCKPRSGALDLHTGINLESLNVEFLLVIDAEGICGLRQNISRTVPVIPELVKILVPLQKVQLTLNGFETRRLAAERPA